MIYRRWELTPHTGLGVVGQGKALRRVELLYEVKIKPHPLTPEHDHLPLAGKGEIPSLFDIC